jgi:toluene monooxygenase system ferredoxin subunit
MTWKAALQQEDLWIGEMVGVQLDGRPVLVVNVDGSVCAYEDRCRHKALPLSLGRLAGTRIFCRAHDWEYDACTGQGVNPSGVALRRFEVRLEAGRILVNLDEA